MQTATLIELFGYLGSFIVLVSFLMTSVFKLRVVNTVGSVLFMIYALIIHSYPTALMNFCLVLINLHFLWKIWKGNKEYELVRVSPEESYLRHMLKTYGDDIRACFPGIDLGCVSPEEAVNGADREGSECKIDVGGSHPDHCYIINCQNKPAGFFLGAGTDESMEILLDYSTPEYRDFSLGAYLMEKLKEEGVHRLSYHGPTEHHMEYLKKMGFRKVHGGFVKELQTVPERD